MTFPYKYRGLGLLLLLAVLLPWATWRFALGDTFGTWRECRRLKARLETLKPAAANPVLRHSDGRELILSGGLLDSIRRAAETYAVRMAGYEPLVTDEQDGVALHTARITLTGGFTALLRVVKHLETSLPRCRLRSLVWRTATDRRTRRTQLTLTLHIQQIVTNRQPT